MQDLINQLTRPNGRTPSQAMFRAAKVLQELAALQQQDLAGRLRAEQELVVMQAEIDRLRKVIHEKETSNTNSSDTANVSPSVTETEVQRDEVSH
jgi:hypothetical protein